MESLRASTANAKALRSEKHLLVALGGLSAEALRCGEPASSGGLLQWVEAAAPQRLTNLSSEGHLYNYGNSSETENSANYCLSQFLNLLFKHQIVREIPSLLRQHWFSQIFSDE